MKKSKIIVLSVVAVVCVAVFTFLFNFNFFSSPKVYTLADGTEIEYYETKSGNTYEFNGFKVERIAIPVNRD